MNMYAARLAFRCPQNFRAYTQGGLSRNVLRRRTGAQAQTLKEPSANLKTPFSIGQGAVAGASVIGIGALAFYGLGLSNEPGTLEKSVAWPSYVQERIQSTFGYFGASLGVSALAATGVFRSPQLMGFVSGGGLLSLGVSMAAMIGSGYMMRSISYQESKGAKHLAWLAHSSILGACVAPICLLGGPLLLRAAMYTGGMLSALSIVSVTAPSEKFLYMGGPLAMGLGVVFASSIGSFFLPPTSLLGASLYSMSLYGGLILFGGFVLYDTQKIIYRAEHTPKYVGWDPINASSGIYLDTLNIFMRIAQILAMNGGNKR
ncbi:growth hormone-inducible transmembrane protein [Lepeophtheirus salmonis]|uniref:Growth hormone-inducible transmembrane protein n=1 Tax=Lepeophtheirus salmonis TaxID=72036 RepID=D3PJ50_LEPSM|nr:growth hormone-inducible transmembrane protein-like [Lepeophtheirus salmonis]ADD38586.1 Growth hormone-inducible transmembrane protein [Lepeophtheirus salmonis]